MLSFRYAADAGAHGVECDVMLTKDKQSECHACRCALCFAGSHLAPQLLTSTVRGFVTVVVFHDQMVKRVLEGTGCVPDMTLAELQALPYRSMGPAGSAPSQLRAAADWDTRGEAIDRVPTLEQLILFCKQRKLKLMIELKEYRFSRLIVSMIIALIDKHGVGETTFVASCTSLIESLSRRSVGVASCAFSSTGVFRHLLFCAVNPWHMWLFRSQRPEIATCLLYCRDLLQR